LVPDTKTLIHLFDDDIPFLGLRLLRAATVVAVAVVAVLNQVLHED